MATPYPASLPHARTAAAKLLLDLDLGQKWLRSKWLIANSSSSSSLLNNMTTRTSSATATSTSATSSSSSEEDFYEHLVALLFSRVTSLFPGLPTSPNVGFARFLWVCAHALDGQKPLLLEDFGFAPPEVEGISINSFSSSSCNNYFVHLDKEIEN